MAQPALRRNSPLHMTDIHRGFPRDPARPEARIRMKQPQILALSRRPDLAISQTEIIPQIAVRSVNLLASQRDRTGTLFKVGDQRILDAEHDVGIDIVIPFHKNMGDELLVARGRYHEMHMRGGRHGGPPPPATLQPDHRSELGSYAA